MTDYYCLVTLKNKDRYLVKSVTTDNYVVACKGIRVVNKNNKGWSWQLSNDGSFDIEDLDKIEVVSWHEADDDLPTGFSRWQHMTNS